MGIEAKYPHSDIWVYRPLGWLRGFCLKDWRNVYDRIEAGEIVTIHDHQFRKAGVIAEEIEKGAIDG